MATLPDKALTGHIISFLESIGIRVAIEHLADDTLLPAMTVRDGGLVVDPERLEWPGDLLHEAGHIAVTDPAERASLNLVSSEPGEEIAAICWSYAASVAIGLDPTVVFHDDGYKGGGGYLAENFTAGRYVGLPLLQWYGMTLDDKNAAAQGAEPYPRMQRWLR